MEEETIDRVDVFGSRCCICGVDTRNKAKHEVFTAIVSSRFEATPLRAGTRGIRTTSYRMIQRHPCRVCLNCKRKDTILTAVVLIITLAALAAYYLPRIHILPNWSAWAISRPLLIGLIAAAFVRAQLDNWFGVEATAKDKAAKLRGAAFKGYTSTEFHFIQA